jgi:hypothetical protein
MGTSRMPTPDPGEMARYLASQYDIEKKDHHYWYRCKKCGSTAGYADEEVCKLMADRHVMFPHPSPTND